MQYLRHAYPRKSLVVYLKFRCDRASFFFAKSGYPALLKAALWLTVHSQLWFPAACVPPRDPVSRLQLEGYGPTWPLYLCQEAIWLLREGFQHCSVQKSLMYESFGSTVGSVLFLMLIGGPTLSRLVVGCSWVGVSCEQDGSEPPGRVTVSLSLNTGEHRPLLQDASLCFFLFPAVLVCYTRWDVVRANGTVCHRCDWNQGWKHVPCFD